MSVVRGKTSRHCFCGRAGTVCMVSPEYPNQRGGGDERHYMCADHAIACKYLVPEGTVPKQKDMDAGRV